MVAEGLSSQSSFVQMIMDLDATSRTCSFEEALLALGEAIVISL